MKTLSVILTAVVLAVGLTGFNRNKVDTGSLKPVETRTVGNITVVLLNSTGELKQGQNEFIVQFRDQQGQPIDVGDVQLSSSMTMPAMAPMSGDSEITATGQKGTYRVKSSFAMSGAWHFTIAWNGPYRQGNTAFNSNVR